MIRVSMEVKEMIETEKIIPRESLNDCIKRGILESRRLKAEKVERQSIETREKLLAIFNGIVINKEIPEVYSIDNSYHGIYCHFYPDDRILKGEVIHHINGNHNDDRPENLMKMTAEEHGGSHKELQKFTPTKSNDIVGR